MEHPWGKKIQVCSNEVPWAIYGPSPSQEPLAQFQPHLVGNMFGGWGFRFVQIKGLAPFGPNKGQNKGQKLAIDIPTFYIIALGYNIYIFYIKCF